MSRKKNPIELRKLSKDTNPRLAELLTEIAGQNDPKENGMAKPTWGRRFNASGKSMGGAPRIRLSYED
jgi:hypothetical protein